MPIWENSDGTLEYMLLVNLGDKPNAAVDNRKNTETKGRTGGQRANPAPTSYARALHPTIRENLRYS